MSALNDIFLMVTGSGYTAEVNGTYVIVDDPVFSYKAGVWGCWAHNKVKLSTTANAIKFLNDRS